MTHGAVAPAVLMFMLLATKFTQKNETLNFRSNRGSCDTKVYIYMFEYSPHGPRNDYKAGRWLANSYSASIDCRMLDVRYAHTYMWHLRNFMGGNVHYTLHSCLYSLFRLSLAYLFWMSISRLA